MENHGSVGLIAALTLGGLVASVVMAVAVLAGWGGGLVAVLVVLGVVSTLMWAAQPSGDGRPPAGA
jgi:hypothetical protein